MEDGAAVEACDDAGLRGNLSAFGTTGTAFGREVAGALGGTPGKFDGAAGATDDEEGVMAVDAGGDLVTAVALLPSGIAPVWRAPPLAAGLL
mmetsp:Transcript_105537/g.264270  ORF Transcript_105537/g.264270 Transcript_105537/m.264270 type:complete len:92 (-) Transcript_105537:54-329(-)